MTPQCPPCSLTSLRSGLSVCARCGAMVWQADADPPMGFYGFWLSWSPAALQAARAGDPDALGLQLLAAGVPGGWRPADLQAVMTALVPNQAAWPAILSRLTPDSADEQYMLQQMTAALAAS